MTTSSETGKGSALKRVARFVGIYAVAAAGVWQAADVAFEALDFPPGAIRLVVVGALAILPLVAVFAWVGSPSAVKRMSADRRHRIVWFVGVAACVGASALAFFALRRNGYSVELPAEVGLARMRETLFSGDLDGGASLAQSLAEREDVPREVKVEAYRHLARAAVRVGDTTEARSALNHLLDLEPPVVLLHPAVEQPELIALYSAARRSRIALNQQRMDLDSAVFSMGPIAVAGIDDSDREMLQRGVSEIVATELNMNSELVLRLVERGENAVSALVEVGSDDQEAFYRAYSDLQAGRVPGVVVETHVIAGSMGVSGDRVLVALWALDLKNALVAAHGLAEGSWPSELAETISHSVRVLAADLKDRRE